MIKKIHTVGILIMLVSLSLSGQAVNVLKGKVTDRSTGEPLIGVTVVEVNELNRTLNGTVTDMNGNFALRLSAPDTKVRISYVGYKSEEFVIEDQDFLEVELAEETRELEEVVVTYEGKKVGGFIPVSERDLTSAVSKVEMSELEEVKASSLGEMLQGRASNVDITICLLYTSPSPRDRTRSRMPSSA